MAEVIAAACERGTLSPTSSVLCPKARGRAFRGGGQRGTPRPCYRVEPAQLRLNDDLGDHSRRTKTSTPPWFHAATDRGGAWCSELTREPSVGGCATRIAKTQQECPVRVGEAPSAQANTVILGCNPM